jgi:hypothetical protein
VLDLLWGGVDLLLSLLTTSAKSKDQVESGLLLNVVVREGTAVLELLAGEDQALLVGWDSLLVLNLGLDIVDGVGRLHLKGDSLTREGLDEDLHGVLDNRNCLPQMSYRFKEEIMNSIRWRVFRAKSRLVITDRVFHGLLPLRARARLWA